MNHDRAADVADAFTRSESAKCDHRVELLIGVAQRRQIISYKDVEERVTRIGGKG